MKNRPQVVDQAAGRPSPAEAAGMAKKLGATGVAVLMLTSDGRVAYSHHGLGRWLGAPAGWLPDGADGRLERVFREAQDGRGDGDDDEEEDDDEDE